jgi:hypothetical protein
VTHLLKSRLVKAAQVREPRFVRLFMGLVLLTVISVALAPSAAWSDNVVSLKGVLEATAASSPNTGNAVFCGGSPLNLVVEAHGNGFTSLGPLSLFLQKTIDVPGAMHGCATLTAPDGDTLNATYDGTEGGPNTNGFISATGTLTFSGGTGRFENAGGKANFSAVFIGLYPANSFLGGNAGVPLQVSAYYTFQGQVVLQGDN